MNPLNLKEYSQASQTESETATVWTRLGPTSIEVGVSLPLHVAKDLSEPNLIKIVESFVQELAEATLTCQVPSNKQSLN
jgi:hypothetical protein